MSMLGENANTILSTLATETGNCNKIEVLLNSDHPLLRQRVGVTDEYWCNEALVTLRREHV
jgi:hypothetical protein